MASISTSLGIVIVVILWWLYEVLHIAPHTMTENHFSDRSLPQGYRNNNPLNIRLSMSPWKGKVINNTNGSFEQFVTMAYGFRAAFINIRTLVRRGHGTIAALIAKWAPDSDGNNSANYAARVAQHMGCPTTQAIDTDNAAMMKALVTAMAIVENGYAPRRADIDKAWQLL